MRPSLPARAGLPARLGAALACFALGSCVQFTSAPGVFFSTNPPGAQVLVDGEESGFITPCAMKLDEDEVHRVDFELEGYETATRLLVPGNKWDLVYFRESDRYPRHFPYPDFHTFEDFFMPVKLDDNLNPYRIHVRMRLAGEE